MISMNFELAPETEYKFSRIMEHYSDKEVFFRDIIRYQVNQLKNGINNIEIDLREYEQKYQLSSNEFHSKFLNGELGDSDDFMVWAGIYEMQLANREKLNELE